MSRIPPLTPPYRPDLQTAFDRIMPPGAPPLDLFRVIATSDRAWQKFAAASLLDRGPLPLRAREIVIHRTCARTHCGYEWGVHVAAFAAAAKFTPAEIAATAQYPSDFAWPPAEQALIDTADALHDRASLTDFEFTNLAAHFSNDQILEILMLAGFYRTVSYLANGLNLAPEHGTPALLK